MTTFVQNNVPLTFDMRFFESLERSSAVTDIDDLLEIYLIHILHIDRVSRIEIQLLNSQNVLMKVAGAKWSGGPINRKPNVYSESWILDYPVKYAAKKKHRENIRPLITVPLKDSGTILGFLNIQLEKIHLLEKNQLSLFYFIGMQVGAKITEIRLKNEISEIRKQLRTQMLTISEIQRQTTSLSKELYAISAISAKINQSMDFDKTLNRCLLTIRRVFKAPIILIYRKNDSTNKLELAIIDNDEDIILDARIRKNIKRIGIKYLKKVLRLGKPLVRELIPESLSLKNGSPTKYQITSLVGVSLDSRQAQIGAMMLLFRSSGIVNHSGLRLLSGVSNIMGMAIENMDLYRRSIQKKDETDFLFKSILTFNKTLNLKTTLTSVAEKGVEFCGFGSRVVVVNKKRTRD